MAPLETQFDLAVKIIQSLPKEGPMQPSDDTKLKFYSYFKQVKVGKCNTTQPWAVQFTERAKWDAWNALGDMTKEVAMQNYVDEFKKLMQEPDDSTPADLKKLIEDFKAAIA